MKHTTKLLIALLMLLTLACGIVRPRETPVAEEPKVVEEDPPAGTVEVTVEVPEVTAVPPDADDASPRLSVNPQALDELTSYRGRIITKVENGQELAEEVTMELMATRDPRAQQISTVMDGESFTFIITENELWMGFGDEWSRMPTDDPEEMLGDFDDLFMDQSELLADIDNVNYEYIGREVVNGYNSHHYRLKYDSMADFMGMEIDEIRNAEADIWIADEPDLPDMMIRLVMIIEATAESEEGTFHITFDIYDVNDPSIVIEPPETAASGGLPAGVPEYPGATNVMSFGGMMSFDTEDDLETVWAFYEENLEAAGWERIDGMDFDDFVMETWERDGQELQLSISVEDDGSTSILIFAGD